MHPNSSVRQLQLTDCEPNSSRLLIWFVVVQMQVRKMAAGGGKKTPNQPPLFEGNTPMGRSLPLRGLHTRITDMKSRQEWGVSKRAHRDNKLRATYVLTPTASLQTGTGKMQMHLLLCSQHTPQCQGAPAQGSLKIKNTPKPTSSLLFIWKHKPDHRGEGGKGTCAEISSRQPRSWGAGLGAREATARNRVQTRTRNMWGRRTAQKYVCFAAFTGDETHVIGGRHEASS